MAGGYEAPKDLGEEIKLLFNTFDRDKDGTISQAELKRLLQHIDPDWTDEELQKLLAGTDSNGDGKLQFTEFWAWIAGHGEDSESSLKEKLMVNAIAEDMENYERFQAAETIRLKAKADAALNEEERKEKERQREAGERVSRKQFLDERADIGLNRHVVAGMFAKADEDRDGDIDRKELGYLAAEQATTVTQIKGLFKEGAYTVGGESEDRIMEEIIATFNAWDKDGDGTVSSEEMLRVIKTLNPKLTTKTAEAMLKQADTNGDGSIDIREFVSWISGVNPKKKKAKEIREAKMSMATHMSRSEEAKRLNLVQKFEEYLHNSYGPVAQKKKVKVECNTLNTAKDRLCTTCHDRHGWLCHGCGFVSFNDECINECGFGNFGWTCLIGSCKKKCGCKKKVEIWQRRGFLQNLDDLSVGVEKILCPPCPPAAEAAPA